MRLDRFKSSPFSWWSLPSGFSPYFSSSGSSCSSFLFIFDHPLCHQFCLFGVFDFLTILVVTFAFSIHSFIHSFIATLIPVLILFCVFDYFCHLVGGSLKICVTASQIKIFLMHYRFFPFFSFSQIANFIYFLWTRFPTNEKVMKILYNSVFQKKYIVSSFSICNVWP